MSPARGKGWTPGDPPSEQQLEEEAIADYDDANPAPGPGRPKVPLNLRRTQQLLLSFTEDEYGELLLGAAKERKQLRKWAREVLLAAIKKETT